jgi:hypothetical protein
VYIRMYTTVHHRAAPLAFVAVDLVVNTTGDSADQPPVAAINAPAARASRAG